MANLAYSSSNVVFKGKNDQVSKIITTLCFYVSLFFLLANDWFNAGVESEDRTSLFVGITYIGIIFPIVVTFLLDKESRKLFLGKVSIIYALLLFVYTINGWILWNNDMVFIQKDLAAFVSVYSGFALFRLILRSFNPKLQLIILIFCCSLIIYLNLSLEAAKLRISTIGIDRRVAEFKGSSQYNAFLDMVSGFAMGVLCRMGWGWNILIWGLLLFRTYSMLFLNARRSAMISIIVLVILSILILSYKLSDGILNKYSSIVHSYQIKLVFLGIGILLLLVSFSDFNIEQIFGNTFIEKRLFNPSSNDQLSSELRFQEALNGIQSMQDLDWIFGRGMGASFLKPFRLVGSNNSLGTTFHIGIFSFLIKGGLPLFAFCFYILFVKFPWLFYRALLKPNAFDPHKRTALLIVLPGTFAWSASLLTVGHLLPIFCLSVGFAFGAYSHIRKYGLRI